eukprot:NODE_2982_length_1302_cov_49.375742_g2833_i0.p1 GENE.NODE_2982_length_1302_cov_49.375742_g2833_i0~~NODE_2982_length_1302_cov_49.375742_g2833_i0.p1  ORF type:complete len:327 (+),score=40.73 NODE_2982_length_1302_cov_49.375742_g2833_i0:91-1071(+)
MLFLYPVISMIPMLLARHLPRDEKKTLGLRITFLRSYYRGFSIMYFYVTAATFEVFNCYEQLDGTKTFRFDPTVTCYESDWSRLLGLSIPFMILYAVIFPSVLCLVVWGGDRPAAESSLFREAAFDVLAKFKGRKAWWETVVILRKLLISVVVVSLIQNTTTKLAVALMTYLGSTALQTRFQPYFKHYSNNLEVIMCTLVTALLVFATSSTDIQDQSVQDGFQVCCAIVLILVLIAALTALSISITPRKITGKLGILTSQDITEDMLLQHHHVEKFGAFLQRPDISDDARRSYIELFSAFKVHDEVTVRARRNSASIFTTRTVAPF